MELALVEFELDMQTFFNADLHLDRLVHFGLLTRVAYDEFFLLRNPIIRPIDNDEDVVPQLDDDSVIALELLFHAIELEVVRHVVH